ncbi:MAG TPA: transglycosylase family protein [Solirubrobacterales bacterium]|nr:transglycosylase family protein [Solirubrobacterales bacterium]
MLTKRKQFLTILLILLAFPAAAYAAGGGDQGGLAWISQAEVAPRADHPATESTTAFPRPVANFRRTVDRISRQIRAEERAEARKRQREQEERFADLPGGVSLETLNAIASCESGGDPTAVSSDGTYRGKYQFDYGTWESVGGHGDPATAPEAEQDYRAALLYTRSGSSPWPVCG